MNNIGLYSLIGIGAVLVIFFLVRNSRSAATQSAVSNDKEGELEQMPQQNIKTENPNDNNSLMNDSELIAVISAAIAASMGSQSNIVVRSIRRVYDPTPVWAKTGRSDVMASRF